jgi:ParB family chromosome partitioning protein
MPAREPGAGFNLARFPKPTVRATEPDEVAQSVDVTAATRLAELSPTAVAEQHLLGDDPEPAVPIEISKIRRSRFQNRKKIDSIYVADLAENLRTDKLNNPIIVRPISNGFFELVTGEHRVEAYKLNGQTHIPGRIRELDDRQAVRAVVLDNHFHRPPHDYERYVGYKMMLEEGAVSSRRALASAVGFTHTQINRLMAFGALPENALAILDENPAIIGANLAEALAAHCTTAIGVEAVVEALKKIAGGELTTARALSWVQGKLGSRAAKSSRVLTFGQGKPFCTMARDGLNIRIKVANGVDSAGLEEAVFEVLRTRAESTAPTKVG